MEVLSNTRWQTLSIGISAPGDPTLWVTRENQLERSELSSLRLGFGGLTYPELITRVQAWAEPMEGGITWTIESTGVVFYGVQFTHTLFVSWATTAYVNYDPPEYSLVFGVIGGPGFAYATGAYVRLPEIYTITYARVVSANPEAPDPFPIYTADGAYWPMTAMRPASGERAWITYALRIGDLRSDTRNPRPDLSWVSATLRIRDDGKTEIRAVLRNSGPAPIPPRVGGFLVALSRRPPDDPPAGPLDGGGFVGWMQGPSGIWLPPLEPGQNLEVTQTAEAQPGRCFFVYADVDPYGETTSGRVWEADEHNNVVRLCPSFMYLPMVLRGGP